MVVSDEELVDRGEEEVVDDESGSPVSVAVEEEVLRGDVFQRRRLERVAQTASHRTSHKCGDLILKDVTQLMRQLL